MSIAPLKLFTCTDRSGRADLLGNSYMCCVGKALVIIKCNSHFNPDNARMRPEFLQPLNPIAPVWDFILSFFGSN